MRQLLVFVPLVAACTTSGSEPVTPAVVGPTHRFVVDSIELPVTPAQGIAFGADLNGDGEIDDALAGLCATLAQEQDLATDVADQIRSGAFAEALELTFGAGGAIGIAIDGSEQLAATAAANGAIASGSARAWEPVLALPIFVDADPIAVPLDIAAIQLDPDGSGGYDVQLQGAAHVDAVEVAAAAGLVQMIAQDPRAHYVLAGELDANHDGRVSVPEVELSPLLADLIVGDLPYGDLSFGLRMHVSPCATGSCTTAPVDDHCADRVLDGDETGLDCGGSCGACGAGVACGSDADCDSHACAAGICAAPRCNDGVLDGFETALDCGGGCGGCAAGQSCVANADCASGVCDGDGLGLGVCGE